MTAVWLSVAVKLSLIHIYVALVLYLRVEIKQAVVRVDAFQQDVYKRQIPTFSSTRNENDRCDRKTHKKNVG